VTPDPGNVPFAIAFDQQNHLVIAEAGPSAVATFTINRNATLSLITCTTTGQAVAHLIWKRAETIGAGTMLRYY
jgi:hypothetical protein